MAHSDRAALANRDQLIELGLNIAFYRRRQSLTQEQLAERVNVSRSFIGEIEAPNLAKAMSLEVLFNIARALEITPSKLLEIRD